VTGWELRAILNYAFCLIILRVRHIMVLALEIKILTPTLNGNCTHFHWIFKTYLELVTRFLAA